MSDDWTTDPNAKRWIKAVLEDMAPKMHDSAVCLSIAPPPDEGEGPGDVKYWVELGAMICMDKPIIVVVFDERQVPTKLRLVADEIVVLRDGVSPESADELVAAVKRQTERAS